jgi:hypothetical protein
MVKESGLEFFNIGGNPQELMMFMVKNAGLLPGFKTIRSGAIQQHRRDMGDIISGCWRSCVETGDGTQGHEAPGDSATDGADHLTAPFVADAIVANPPSLAHIHCAEKLGIPLTIMFTSVFIKKAPIGNTRWDAKSTVFWTGCHGRQLKHSPTRLPVSDDIAPSQPLRILYPMLL